jgi:hypothetical protein
MVKVKREMGDGKWRYLYISGLLRDVVNDE